MGKQPQPARVNRRAFLRIAGLAAGALATPPVFTTSASGAATTAWASTNHQQPLNDPLRVGVLLPQSQIYPAAAPNFRAGMDLYLAQAASNSANRPIALLAHDYGITPSVALAQARQLIASDQVDLIVGSLSSGVAAALHPLLHERKTPLLISSIGANLTRDDRQSPYIIRNSFSYWQSSWALGRWAAGNLGKQAFVASSFYDSGYDSLYAFQLGFESAGGTVQSTKVTHIPAGAGDLHALMAGIQQVRPDLVFGAYSGPQASDFVRAYASAGLSARIPLLGSGFLVDESLLPEQGDAALGIRTALPWARTLDLPANQAFTSAFGSFSGRPADPFAVLGYDTARLITQCACNTNSPEELRQALANASFESPRGAVRMDAALLEAEAPLYLREVRAGHAGLEHSVIGRLPAVPIENPQIAALRASLLTGWSNAYMYV